MFETVLWPPLWLYILGPPILSQILLWDSQIKDGEVEEDLSTNVSNFLPKNLQNKKAINDETISWGTDKLLGFMAHLCHLLAI